MPKNGTENQSIGVENSFIIDRVKNGTGSAEGAILPPRQVGSVRVPIVSGFRVLTRNGFLGGTEFALAFSPPPLVQNISNFLFWYRAAGASSFSQAGASVSSPVTIRIPISDPVNVVFICQTVLSNGFASLLDQSPSCTSETIETTITPGSIAGLDLVFGGAAMTPAGRVPYVAAPGILTTDGQFQFDEATKHFGVGAGAVTSGLTTDKSVAFGVKTVQNADFTLDDEWMVPIDTSGGAVNVTLPPAAGLPGRWYVLKKVTSDANGITITADGSDTVDGLSSQTVTSAYGLLSVVRTSATEWSLI
jgi:hypothetical protein